MPRCCTKDFKPGQVGGQRFQRWILWFGRKGEGAALRIYPPQADEKDVQDVGGRVRHRNWFCSL